MAGVSEEGVSVEETGADKSKRGLSGSMSMKTRKLGRRLSRSMSIVALKLPEKAHNITRSSSKLMRSAHRDKKNRSFDLSIILPDKTQKQVTVWGNNTVAEVVSEPLHEVGMLVAGLPSGPLSLPMMLPLSEPLPPPAATVAPPTVLLFLGGSKAPVDPRAPAISLEGEVLVVENEPPQWDGKNLEDFLAWEKIYASTLFSALELYGKPLLRAAVITKEEYHLLFYYLESVSEASEALTERMRKYIESGLLKTRDDNVNIDDEKLISKLDKNIDSNSILNEMVKEGLLTQQDIISSHTSSLEYEDQLSINPKTDDDNKSIASSVTSSIQKVVDIPFDSSESIIESTIESCDNVTTVTIRSSGQCCIDHRISADVSENVWSNVKWDFLNPADFGYDQIPNVKRSQSESAITPIVARRKEEIYEQVPDDEGESCDDMTPYESIEDLYDCIKNSAYNNIESEDIEETSPSTETQSEPQYQDYYEKASTTRQSSASSEKSEVSSAFPFSKCGSSDSTGAYTSCESTSGISSYIPKRISETIKCRELPPPPVEGEDNESTILLRQLFFGELMDSYGEYLAAYPFARALLRRKTRRDEHFAALSDIRRGAAKYTIKDYLELPVSVIYII